MEGCLSPLISYEQGILQLLTHSGQSSVVSGDVPEDSPHHHATAAQDALRQGSLEAAALQGAAAPLRCGALPRPLSHRRVPRAVAVRGSPGVRNRPKYCGQLGKSSHGVCGLAELQSSRDTQHQAPSSPCDRLPSGTLLCFKLLRRLRKTQMHYV